MLVQRQVYEYRGRSRGKTIVYSGWSKHMRRIQSLFQNLDEAVKQTVRLGDNNKMQVTSVGTIALWSSLRKVRSIKQVQYVPCFVHNLLSVGQLLGSSYMNVFANEECIIKDEDAKSILAWVKMSKHKLFPLDVDEVGEDHVVLSK